MATPLETLVQAGTKLWLDSVDPDFVLKNRASGATGATSNPIIVADLLASGRFDDELMAAIEDGKSDAHIAWHMTDRLVTMAQQAFHEVWTKSEGNDGYVSFELDPLLEDTELAPAHDERVKQYIELGKRWAAGQDNRMIKVPATPAGIAALEPLAAAGITLNVTLVFSPRQYEAAREAIWRGAQQRADGLDRFKSVYSIFVSRVDVYTEKHVSSLSPAAQGMVGIVNAKRIWKQNEEFWAAKGTKLQQEIIFASTGTKKPEDPADKYVAAFAGSGIETNPPATNDAVQELGKIYSRSVDEMPSQEVLDDIDAKIDMQHLEETLVSEGLVKFADPQKKLLKLIGERRESLTTAK